MISHETVLLHEAVDGLNIKPNGVYVDATFGAGGHSKEIFEKLDSKGRLIAFDQDADVTFSQDWDDRFLLVRSNFRYMLYYMEYLGLESIDGVLADLGVSSHHLDTPERGFSYRYDAPLDMRMRQTSGMTAARIIKEYSEGQLQSVFSRYGELRNSKTLARRITEQRSQRSIGTTLELVEVVEPIIRGQKDRYLAQLFQALRIEVNDELGAIKQLLIAAERFLAPGGRLSVISFHSLEDRLIKKAMKATIEVSEAHEKIYGAGKEVYRSITRKPITASDEELKRNPRARSAKLRIAEKR